jgi:hypothetical protein
MYNRKVEQHHSTKQDRSRTVHSAKKHCTSMPSLNPNPNPNPNRDLSLAL